MILKTKTKKTKSGRRIAIPKKRFILVLFLLINGWRPASSENRTNMETELWFFVIITAIASTCFSLSYYIICYTFMSSSTLVLIDCDFRCSTFLDMSTVSISYKIWRLPHGNERTQTLRNIIHWCWTQWGYYSHFRATSKNYSKALASHEKEIWLKAIDKEHQRMVLNKVWTEVNRNEVRPNGKIFTTTLAMKKKQTVHTEQE
jgi:hypothetical protein